ncbi:HK97 gp10 family phage protein [uncultured Clostridium sp.]|jgi:HK97 gp10 family phage protein|uniref:HK97 gp10 family phage protein n=1 Tax=uncultured Clostridium sp. TaxID=59620 RepID=UPI0025D68B91|nr:HK97 gp10 family phage protein [uncultured Clostridium sp.]
MARFEIEGMKELQKSMKRLGKVPQKCVTPAARKGMNIALRSARKNAPIDTGELKSGMKLVGEKSRVKAKKVYQVVFDSSKNDIFQKKNKEGKVIGYYPASQEYGFFARNGRYIPGYHFMKRAMEDNSGSIAKTIVNEVGKNIDKELGGR